MATKILIATFQLGTIAPHNAGDLITDAKLQSQLTAQGAVLVDQSANPGIDALATLARKERASGRRRNAEAIMLAGYINALAGGPGVGGAAMVGPIQKRSVSIAFGQFAGLLAGVKTFDANVGAVLPSGARIISAEAAGVTDFDDATHGTFVQTIGVTAGGNTIGTSLNVAAGQTGFPKAFAVGTGGYLGALNSAAQLSTRLTSSVDLNTTTAGAITVNVFFTQLP